MPPGGDRIDRVIYAGVNAYTRSARRVVTAAEMCEALASLGYTVPQRWQEIGRFYVRWHAEFRGAPCPKSARRPVVRERVPWQYD